MVERFNGRIQREVLGITVASHRDLETLLHGFNRAYNGRRQRVLKGRSPERVVHERLGAVPTRANSSHDPPFNPCALPKALQVIARAKDVSHPDTPPCLQTSNAHGPHPYRPCPRSVGPSALAQDYNRQGLVRGLCQKDGCDEFTILAADRIKMIEDGVLRPTVR